MTHRSVLFSAVALVAVVTAASPQAGARIVRLEIVRTVPAFDGISFGAIGPYQHVFARAYGELDPADPHNTIIQDLSLAPRDAHGMVDYSTDVEFLRPADASRSNGALLFEVNNRGNKLAIAAFDAGVPLGTSDRNALANPGDGWLMRQGYTLVWWGWEMDAMPGWNRVLMPPITAHHPDGSPVTGLVRSEIVTPRPVATIPINESQQIQSYPFDSYDSYPTASLDNHTPAPDGFLPSLTVRAHAQDPRIPIPNSDWSFGVCEPGQPERPDPKHLCLAGGFQPGHLYELIYRARDPLVLGIGFAASRDVGAFLRGAQRDDTGAANPLFHPGQIAVIEGSSQSGRMIRSLLALGFNEDEFGRRVFDGAYPHIGGGLMPLNVRFGQPVRAWGEQTDNIYPAYDFPFTYGRELDPLTGRDQGLLDRCRATDTCPRIFHVATVLEMWEGRQSLGLTDRLGREDVADPPNVRTYIMASTQHGPAALPLAAKPPFGNCQQHPNPNPQVWTMRALLTDLVAWVQAGVAPPPSTAPRIADGTMVAPDQVHFPVIPANHYQEIERPAVSTARVYNTLHVLDFGPLYRAGDSSGVITVVPPRVGTASYGVLVPQVDADGNDIGGIRSVFVQVPIGTYTGWNLGRAGRFEGGLCNLQGSFIPFAATRAERNAIGDSRLSIEERYPNAETYVAQFRAAADRLVSDRFLLPDDAQTLLDQAVRTGIRSAP